MSATGPALGAGLEDAQVGAESIQEPAHFGGLSRDGLVASLLGVGVVSASNAFDLAEVESEDGVSGRVAPWREMGAVANAIVPRSHSHGAQGFSWREAEDRLEIGQVAVQNA